MSPLKNPPFGNAVPESLYKTAVLCMSKMSLMEIGQRSYCGPQTLGHPAADARVTGSAAIPVDFPKARIFRKLIKLMNSLSMYNTKN